MQTSLSNAHTLQLSNIERSNLLEKLLIYYEMHINSFKNIKTVEVLKDIFE